MLDEIKKKLSAHSQHILGEERMRRYAVTIPLIQQNETLFVLFEKRALHIRRQPGEISFPGGKIEEQDKSIMGAAIRETSEELGIDEKNIEILEKLGAFVPSRHTIIYPFVASIQTDSFRPNPDEVDHVFLVPLSFFTDHPPQKHRIKLTVEPDESFPFHLIPGGENYPWRFSHVEENFYQYKDYVIWGMTAHILQHFIALLKSS